MGRIARMSIFDSFSVLARHRSEGLRIRFVNVDGFSDALNVHMCVGETYCSDIVWLALPVQWDDKNDSETFVYLFYK
jgi:hypothetical protein